MKSVATDKLTTANLHKYVNQDKMTKTDRAYISTENVKILMKKVF